MAVAYGVCALEPFCAAAEEHREDAKTGRTRNHGHSTCDDPRIAGPHRHGARHGSFASCHAGTVQCQRSECK